MSYGRAETRNSWEGDGRVVEASGANMARGGNTHEKGTLLSEKLIYAAMQGVQINR